MLTRDDIIRMMDWHPSFDRNQTDGLLARIERVAKAAADAEREACARLVERDDSMRWSGAADAIRARGQQRPEPTYPSDPIWREQKRLEMEAWARDKLARHGIQIPEDDDGNPSF